IAHDRSPAALAAVSAYCERLAALAESLRPLVEGTPWVSAGGSAYFDLVADAFAPLTGVRRILRSGAYIVHDSGFYRGISPLDTTRGLAEEEALLPAMRPHARAASTPEPGRALRDARRRDAPPPDAPDTARALAEEEAPLPAVRAHARVASTPEPGLALLDAGKRDVPYDEGLPVPLGVAAELGGWERPLDGEITALNDQHAFLRHT